MITANFTGLKADKTYYVRVFPKTPRNRYQSMREGQNTSAYLENREPTKYEYLVHYTSNSTWTVPHTGHYKIHVFGACGSGGRGGKSGISQNDWGKGGSGGAGGNSGGYASSVFFIEEGTLCEITASRTARFKFNTYEIYATAGGSGGDGQTPTDVFPDENEYVPGGSPSATVGMGYGGEVNRQGLRGGTGGIGGSVLNEGDSWDFKYNSTSGTQGESPSGIAGGSGGSPGTSSYSDHMGGGGGGGGARYPIDIYCSSSGASGGKGADAISNSPNGSPGASGTITGIIPILVGGGGGGGGGSSRGSSDGGAGGAGTPAIVIIEEGKYD